MSGQDTTSVEDFQVFQRVLRILTGGPTKDLPLIADWLPGGKPVPRIYGRAVSAEHIISPSLEDALNALGVVAAEGMEKLLQARVDTPEGKYAQLQEIAAIMRQLEQPYLEQLKNASAEEITSLLEAGDLLERGAVAVGLLVVGELVPNVPSLTVKAGGVEVEAHAPAPDRFHE